MEPNLDVEQLFLFFDDTAEQIKNDSNLTYLEGLAEAGEYLIEESVTERKRIAQRLKEIDYRSLPSETIRKAFQLAVLKGVKEGVQPHHQPTPDSVALFISYLINKLVNEKQELTMLDPAVGTGNLLTAVVNQRAGKTLACGFEVDETLIKLAYVSANLQRIDMELFHMDSIQPFDLKQVDIVLSDLPIGYYPKEEVAKLFELKSNTGRSYVHHLMIEQSLNRTKAGGFLIFIIPNFIFESNEARSLHAYIKERAFILGLLQLPDTMFKDASHGKSIFLLQKRGEGIVEPRQALLAQLPSFSRKEALSDMVKRIDQWFENELRTRS